MFDWSTRLLLSGSLLLTTAGCVGARGSLAFDDVKYPISMSPHLEDRSGRALSPDQLEVVGKVKYDTTFWGTLYSLVPLTGEKDVSQPINDQVRAAEGDGVVGLTVVSDWCTLNYVPLLTLLPVWPGCADVSFSGKIVKIKAPAAKRSAARARDAAKKTARARAKVAQATRQAASAATARRPAPTTAPATVQPTSADAAPATAVEHAALTATTDTTSSEPDPREPSEPDTAVQAPAAAADPTEPVKQP